MCKYPFEALLSVLWGRYLDVELPEHLLDWCSVEDTFETLLFIALREHCLSEKIPEVSRDVPAVADTVGKHPGLGVRTHIPP